MKIELTRDDAITIVRALEDRGQAQQSSGLPLELAINQALARERERIAHHIRRAIDADAQQRAEAGQ